MDSVSKTMVIFWFVSGLAAAVTIAYSQGMKIKDVPFVLVTILFGFVGATPILLSFLEKNKFLKRFGEIDLIQSRRNRLAKRRRK